MKGALDRAVIRRRLEKAKTWGLRDREQNPKRIE